MPTGLKYLPLLLLLALAACKGSEPGSPQTAVASIVTYESTTDGESTFTYTDNNDDLITLTAKWHGNSDLTAGSRALIYYVADQYGVSGPISLLSVVRIPFSAPKILVPGATLPKSEKLNECTLWRSGNYLNISAIVTFPGKAAEVALYLDETTAKQPYPTAYVIVTSDYSDLGVERALYSSWAISSILSAPNCQGLNIIYNETNQLTITNKK